MATTIKSRFPLLLLLGIIFLASVCVTYANYDEGTEPRVPGKRERGRQEGEKEEKHHGELRPSYEKQEDEEEEHRYHYHREKTGQRERGRQEGEKEDKHHGEWIPPYEKEEYEKKEQKKTQPGRERWDREQDEEEVEESRGSQRTEPRVPGQRERGRQEGEKEEKRHGEWIPSYGKEEDEEEKHRYHPEKTGQRERGRQEGEKEDKHHGEWIPSYEKEEYEKKEQKKTQPGRERWDREEDEKEVEQSRGSQPTEPRVPGQRERGRQEGEKEEKRHGEWIPSYGKEEDEEEKHRYHPEKTGQRERGRQEGEKEEKRRGEWISSYENEEDEEEKKYPYHYHPEKKEQKEAQPGSERWEKVEDEEQVEEQWRGSQRHEDPDERARERYRREIAKREVEEEREERDKHHQHEGSSKSQEQRNPFLFKSNKFLTLYENENGYIRRLQRFDERSDIFENLQNYRLVEYRAKPHTIFLPQHIDADLILTVLSGKAILTVLSPNDRNSYNLERGDIIKIPAGTTSYIVNQDDEEDLRVVDLVISVNRPGKFEAFDLSKNKNQYLRGFSKNILEASLNTKYETIERVLLGERRQQGQEIDAIVKVSREQIVELRKLAKSSLRKILPSEFEPLNLRSQNPIYSNKFGKFFEITPEKKHPQLQDLDIFVSSVEINEGALFLPHYNSRAIVVLFVNEGRGNLELVGFKNEQQERREREDEQQERNNQVQRYEARLSPGDVVIIPSGHPVAVSASSNLNLLGFGINAENNQRNFLTGSEDNVISQIENPVKEVTFPGSAQEVNRLLKNQEHSHFANAEPEQKEEESQGKSSLLSSILKTYY